MSLSDSSSQSSSDCDDCSSESQVSREEIHAYADEPLADEEWLKNYEREEEENKKLEQALQARLDSTEQVGDGGVLGLQYITEMSKRNALLGQ